MTTNIDVTIRSFPKTCHPTSLKPCTRRVKSVEFYP
jgi:hypothetical protein